MADLTPSDWLGNVVPDRETDGEDEMAGLTPSDWLGDVAPDRETDDEEDVMAGLTPPKQLVKDESGHWYVVLRWSDRYSYIADAEALRRLHDRAEDDPNYAETRDDWQSAWFDGMIREQDRTS